MATEQDATIWCFLNSKDESQQVTVMGLKSARIFTSLLPKPQHPQWTVRQYGAQNTKAVADSPILFGDPSEQVRDNLAEFMVETISLVKDQNAVKTGAERRQHKRYVARLKVIILSGERIFDACTTNVSLGGLLLENPVPVEFINRECQVILTSPDNMSNVQFEAKILESSVRGSRLMFGDQLSAGNLEIYKEWLRALALRPENKKAA